MRTAFREMPKCRTRRAHRRLWRGLERVSRMRPRFVSGGTGRRASGGRLAAVAAPLAIGQDTTDAGSPQRVSDGEVSNSQEEAPPA